MSPYQQRFLLRMLLWCSLAALLAPASGSLAQTTPPSGTWPVYLPFVVQQGTPAPTATPTSNPTAMILPSATTIVTISPTGTATASATATSTASATATSTASATATSTASATATSASTSTSTNTPAATATSTSTPTSTSATATSTPTQAPTSYGVRGAVFVKPRWSSPAPPVNYLVVLDTSGAMSLDAAGHGTLGGNVRVKRDSTGGKDYLCAPSVSPGANESLPLKTDCALGGNGAVWRQYQERRIFIAKAMITTLVNRMGPNDVMRIVAASSAINGATQVLPAAGWSSDKTTLIDAATNAGMYHNDPYRTSGYTNTADAFLKARTLLSSAPTRAVDGRDYRQVVIYIGTGVANVFLGGGVNTAADICPGMPVAMVLQTARCQTGITADGRLRPITAGIDQANKMKQANPSLTVYALGFNEITALAQVASSPSDAFAIPTAAAAADALKRVLADANACLEAGASGAYYIDNIPAANVATFSGANALPVGVYGYVSLYDEHQQPLPAPQNKIPIVEDSITGQLTWSLPPGSRLAPGSYVATAYVGYKGPDGVSRVYSTFTDQATLTSGTTMSFSVSASQVSGDAVIITPMYLDLTSLVCPRQ